MRTHARQAWEARQQLPVRKHVQERDVLDVRHQWDKRAPDAWASGEVDAGFEHADVLLEMRRVTEMEDEPAGMLRARKCPEPRVSKCARRGTRRAALPRRARPERIGRSSPAHHSVKVSFLVALYIHGIFRLSRLDVKLRMEAGGGYKSRGMWREAVQNIFM
jgi:hypothetical protein